MIKFNVIGYCGPIGSGKDYEASKLIENEKYVKVNFADDLLGDLYDSLKWKPSNHEEYEKFKKMQIHDNFNGRDLIKNYGETMKKLHGEDYWANRWYKKIYILMCRGHKNFVVSDVRFAMEFKCVQYFNGKVYFTRYESEKFFLDRESQSEKIAVELYDKNIKHLEDITNLY